MTETGKGREGFSDYSSSSEIENVTHRSCLFKKKKKRVRGVQALEDETLGFVGTTR